MDYVDEEFRPRFLLHSRPSSSSSLNPNLNAPKPSKLHGVFCLAAAAAFLFAGVSFSSSVPFISSVLLWSSFSLLLAPFAPSSLTGGDIRVGLGPPLPDPDPIPDPDPKPSSRVPARRIRPLITDPAPIATSRSEKMPPETPVANGGRSEMEIVEEEWTEADLEMLKKQIAKHPVGEPRRWERIQEAFRARHGLESVIKMGKSLGERKPGDSDSYERFLKQRKPVDKRVSVVEEGVAGGDGGGGRGWSSGEDLALLNALKEFPKDAAMRWEKVAAALPGRSKAECVKRVAELKRDFRNAKASQT